MQPLIIRNILSLALILWVFSTSFAKFEQKIVQSDPVKNDEFGKAVAIDGDYAVVGAHFKSDNGTFSGSAYIFQRNGTTWTEQAKLIASDASAYAQFGSSVAISGDYAIIGAFGDSSAQGTAYIFQRNGTTWTEQAKLIASDGFTNDRFGFAVSISGDYAIIGAYLQEETGFFDSGSAYIFHRSGTIWSEQEKLIANDASNGAQFGASVSIDGDYALIGAHFDNNTGNGNNAGSAYIFHRSGTNWIQQTKLIEDFTGTNPTAGNIFGSSVSINGDYAIVGARVGDVTDINSPVTNSGAAFIYNRSGASWSLQTKLTASDAAQNDEFGFSVSIEDSFAVIGAHFDDDVGSASGSVYIFSRNGNSWSQQTKLTANDITGGHRYGHSVALDGNYVVIGARYAGNSNIFQGSFAGATYISSVNPFVNGNISQTVSGNSTISFNEGSESNTSSNEDTGIDIAFTGVTNSANIQIESFPEPPTGTNGINETVQEVRWVITNSGLNFTNAEIRVDMTSLPITINFPNSAVIYHRPIAGSGTFTALPTTVDADTLVANTSSFSEFTIGGGDGSLPINLTFFEAKQATKGIKLFWETETETDNLGFKIKRSHSKESNFKTIVSYLNDENLKGQINSSFPTSYEWIDTSVKVGEKYFYYISDIDLNGNEIEHKDKMISIISDSFEDFSENPEVAENFVLEQNFPNPFNPNTTINYQIRAKDLKFAKLEIYNSKGQFIKEFSLVEPKGSIVWNGENDFGKPVSSGIYFYKLTTNGFSQTNKMLLLK